jgi:SAM-dependent methyltransferase
MADDPGERQFEKWSQTDKWNYFLPPSRPSQEHLNFYRTCILSSSAPRRVAILGSTPELRDLCVEVGNTDVDVIEINKIFHEQLDKLRVYPESCERTHIGDWLDVLPDLNSAFDVILSDLTLGNIDYSDRSEYFSGIHHALRPGGIFVDKVLTFGRQPLRTLDSLEQKYSAAPFNIATVSDFANDFYFTSEAICGEIIDVATIRAMLKSRYAATSNHASQRLLKFVQATGELLPDVGTWAYGRDWDLKDHTAALDLELIAHYWEKPPSVFASRLFMAAFRRMGN